jgi:hypothetical protein
MFILVPSSLLFLSPAFTAWIAAAKYIKIYCVYQLKLYHNPPKAASLKIGEI